MELFTDDDLRELVTIENNHVVSIFLPMYHKGEEVQQNPIRLKNALNKAVSMLAERGVRSTVASDYIEPAKRLVGNSAFWRFQADGLAIFIAPGLFKVFRLQVKFNEQVVIGQHCYIKPLLHLLSGNTKFYVLDLNISGPRIFSGTKFALSEIESEKMPKGIDETLGFDVMEKNVQFSSQPAIIGGVSVNVFGYGRQTDKKKVNIVNYYHHVNKSVLDIIGNSSKAPMVLAGVDYLHPLYMKANTYGNIPEKGITGSISDMAINQLYEKAWACVEELFTNNLSRDTENYKILSGERKNIAANDLKTIVSSAMHGRISTLFIADGTTVLWGKITESRHQLEIHDTPEPDDEDLLDTAAIHTLLRGGVVHVLEKEQMPDNTPIAALLRY
jgi:hypothetical protein